MRTGGGPSQPEKDIIPDVESVVPHLTFEVENIFDSDAGPSNSQTPNITEKIDLISEGVYIIYYIIMLCI